MRAKAPDRLRGVTPTGTFEAPFVVRCAGIHPTVLELIDAEHFDRSDVNYVKGLAPGWGFTSIRCFLDRPVMDTYRAAKSGRAVARRIEQQRAHARDTVTVAVAADRPVAPVTGCARRQGAVGRG